MKIKQYYCVGFNHKENNWHLCKHVGDTYTLDEWLRIAYPKQSEDFLKDYFEGWKPKDITDYLFVNMGIRLVKA